MDELESRPVAPGFEAGPASLEADQRARPTRARLAAADAPAVAATKKLRGDARSRLRKDFGDASFMSSLEVLGSGAVLGLVLGSIIGSFLFGFKEVIATFFEGHIKMGVVLALLPCVVVAACASLFVQAYFTRRYLPYFRKLLTQSDVVLLVLQGELKEHKPASPGPPKGKAARRDQADASTTVGAPKSFAELMQNFVHDFDPEQLKGLSSTPLPRAPFAKVSNAMETAQWFSWATVLGAPSLLAQPLSWLSDMFGSAEKAAMRQALLEFFD